MSSSDNNAWTRTLESPTDLLDRISKISAVISMIETGSRIAPPIPIPVYSPAQYYSLTGAEREDYHTLQQMFYGGIMVPGLAATMPGRGKAFKGLSISTPITRTGTPITRTGTPITRTGTPITRTGSPVVGRWAQSWPESGRSSGAESVCSDETLPGRLTPTEYEAFANWNPYLRSRSRASSVYDGDVADSHRHEGIVSCEETMVGRPPPEEYEELAKGNPHCK